uniref:Peptidase_M13 domain-containing protein n=1 Tax=Elaeophora elaphi TaxID=1147741 RepID=A0A0R3RN46_9BILA
MSINDTALTEYYKNLNITREDTYFEALRKIATWDAERYFLRLKKPFDKYEFVQSASTVNAFFTFRMNSLTLPAGFLTSPFFNRYYPKAANYGAIGTVMGHELTHGFDDDDYELLTGSLYDMNGNLNNWWSQESYKNFKNKAQCFIEQYNSYKVPNTEFKSFTRRVYVLRWNCCGHLAELLFDGELISPKHKILAEYSSNHRIAFTH